MACSPNDTIANCYSSQDAGLHIYGGIFGNDDGQCVDLRSSDENCGACGVDCAKSADGPTCKNGVCGCQTSDVCFGVAGYCDTVSKKCAKCPVAGIVNCLGLSSGTSADCSVNTLNNTSNCGGCNIQCNVGEICNNGVCQCGSNNGTACMDPGAPYCISGACMACDNSTLGIDDACWSTTQDSQYCAIDGTCKTCPAGLGDCTASGDVGTTQDCETSLLATGKTNNCGACGVPAGTTPTSTITCCNGVPTCGKFVNASAPTAEECLANRACGEHEYCDSTFHQCLPLENYDTRRNCDGTVTSATGGLTNVYNFDPYAVARCGSCRRNETLLNVMKGTDLANKVRYECLLGHNGQCGTPHNSSCYLPSGEYGVCVNGKCARGTSAPALMVSWTPFVDANPDSTVFVGGSGAMAPSQCSSVDIFDVANGYANYYVARYARSFFTCVQIYEPSLTNNSVVTYETFANKSSRDVFCNGQEGMCTSSYCDDLYANATRYVAPFCDALNGAIQKSRSCMSGLKFTPEAPVPQVAKETFVHEGDLDMSYALRSTCLSSAYSEFSSAGLLLNAAIFYQCPFLPDSVTKGAKFYIKNDFRTALGRANTAPLACLATYGAASDLRSSSSVVLAVIAMVVAASSW